MRARHLNRPLLAPTLLLLVSGCAGAPAPSTEELESPMLIAHRGASGYAPEHTLAAYRIAIAQGADFIEPDLQITKDSVLIALHDLTLERTTNVSEVYPDRYTEEVSEEETVRRWYASDFTLEEIRRLDAGGWFAPEFAGERVPTFGEVIELAKGVVGIYPETKAPEVYGRLAFDMEQLVVDELARHGLAVAGADPATPVVIQSFSAESLRVLQERGSTLPRTFLISGDAASEWMTPEGLASARSFATAIGPAKNLILDDPDMVRRAHEERLAVVAWTFRADRPGDFDSVEEEMAYFLFDLGVDGLFTNNPDLYPGTEPRPDALPS